MRNESIDYTRRKVCIRTSGRGFESRRLHIIEPAAYMVVGFVCYM